MQHHLKVVEKKLTALATQDKQTWIEFYKLLKEVEEHQLYKEAKAKSFTAWVKQFASNNKIHESVIWARKKAGETYTRYKDIKAEKGEEVVALEDVNVSPESLVLAEQIIRKAPDMGAELIDKVLNNELSRQDLRDMHKSLRSNISKEVVDVTPATDTDESTNKAAIEDAITATEIATSLSNPAWLGKSKQVKRFKSVEEQDKYRAFTEFSVKTGSTRGLRKVDVFVAENLTLDCWGINLHAIEIKVSKSDFLRDTKYTEYAEFADFLWIAIPAALLEIVVGHSPESCGIITVESGKATISRQATKLQPRYEKML